MNKRALVVQNTLLCRARLTFFPPQVKLIYKHLLQKTRDMAFCTNFQIADVVGARSLLTFPDRAFLQSSNTFASALAQSPRSSSLCSSLYLFFPEERDGHHNNTTTTLWDDVFCERIRKWGAQVKVSEKA